MKKIIFWSLVMFGLTYSCANTCKAADALHSLNLSSYVHEISDCAEVDTLAKTPKGILVLKISSPFFVTHGASFRLTPYISDAHYYTTKVRRYCLELWLVNKATNKLSLWWIYERCLETERDLQRLNNKANKWYLRIL